MELKKTLEKAVIPAEKYRNELFELNKKLHVNIILSMEKDQKTDKNNISTSTSDLINSNGKQGKYSDDVIKFMENFEKDAKNQRIHTQKLIDDNIDLRIR